MFASTVHLLRKLKKEWKLGQRSEFFACGITGRLVSTRLETASTGFVVAFNGLLGEDFSSECKYNPQGVRKHTSDEL